MPATSANVILFCDSLSSRARRADHEHAFRNLATEALEFGGVFQEIDDLDDFFFRFLDAGDVSERDADLVLAEQTRAALAERHRTAAAARALHLPHEVNPNADQEQDRERGDQQLHEEIRLTRRARHDLGAVREELVDERAVVILGAVGNKFGIGTTATASNHVALELDLSHGPVFDPSHELGIGDGRRGRTAAAESAHDRPQYDRYDYPENHVFCEIVQDVTSSPSCPSPARV